MKKFLKIIESIGLCILFPFLYPRNRFTGNHYDNPRIRRFCSICNATSKKLLKIRIIREIDKSPDLKLRRIGKMFDEGHLVTVYKDEDPKFNYITISNTFLPSVTMKINSEDLLKYGSIWEAGFEGNDPRENSTELIVIVTNNSIVPDSGMSFKAWTIEPWLYNISKIFKFWNDWVLAFFHCIPKFHELGALDNGWRKKFGLKMCFEIEYNLIKYGGLLAPYRFRVDQIKEKYGKLEFYAHNIPEGMDFYGIIEKYRTLSEKTCNVCGKPATKRTIGYILPFCDNCFPKNRSYTEIK